METNKEIRNDELKTSMITLKLQNDKESKKMAYLLSKHFKLDDLRNLTNDEINFLPEMNEIEFDGLNDTINYTNMESNNDPGDELLVYKLDDFVLGIEQCSDYILNQLKEFGLYK